MPSRRATESATAWLSPVIMATRTPRRVQRVDRFLRLGSDLVLDGHDAGHGAVDDDVEDRPALPSQSAAWRIAASRPSLGEQPRSANENVVAVDPGARTATGQRLEVGGWPGLDASLPGAFDDRARERVLGVGLDRRRETEDTFGVHRARRDVDQDRARPS